jgi:hypothetical protein
MKAARAPLGRNALCSLVLGLAVLTGGAGRDALAEQEAPPSKVSAKYNIHFNGINIGNFKLLAQLANGEYNMSAQARISLLAGMLFEWSGSTASSGRVMSRGPLPYAYSFGYKTSEKSEKIDVKFSNNVVREIAVNPPQRPSSSRVPVTRKHMQNVVDPLSAVFMLTNVGANKSGGEVCGRRLPIFDGKARYDLQLSYKGAKQITAVNGYKGPAYICKVKFIPIAGHKAEDDDNSYAAKNDGIEVWMMPIPQAGLYVPYYIYVPTPVGTATLNSAAFTVEALGDNRRALIQ